MKKPWIPIVAMTLVACGDFVDEDGNTSIRQVAQGLQSLGDRVAELGETIERDAAVEAVPWTELRQVIPEQIGGSERLQTDGEDARDRNGAGISMAAGKYRVRGDSLFVGVADLGALRGGAQLALRWIAPVFSRGEIDGDVEEIEVDGQPAICIRGDEDRGGDGGVLVALLFEGRFAVVAGVQGQGRASEDLVYDGLDAVDFAQLGRWTDYGTD